MYVLRLLAITILSNTQREKEIRLFFGSFFLFSFFVLYIYHSDSITATIIELYRLLQTVCASECVQCIDIDRSVFFFLFLSHSRFAFVLCYRCAAAAAAIINTSMNRSELMFPSHFQIIVGDVNVSILNRKSKYQYKDDYEKFKLILNGIGLFMAIINLSHNSR